MRSGTGRSWSRVCTFTDRALPAVQPVAFHLDGERIVIRTGIGSKLAAATRNAVVAFEADEFDPEERTGWSVTVIGHARGARPGRDRRAGRAASDRVGAGRPSPICAPRPPCCPEDIHRASASSTATG
ncbi:pyridoxamine 5'-phosphate oxidase family protein [Nonomuraea rubra]|uniref:pyridoxamine 5'-phosphate oxidase family protein n=1 Tax=Nonomuraea rubra TaxID=46180 RepID=UPI0033D764CE